ncbi:MAG: bifunctional tRNA (5-methylaminomethyl-2-thiouridine)(34)-methyltransferase MnmD/FAD-dependent 5-carboxymethylaminomethyl-2-thiouridine(34) oxidoreductase MnmC [Legionella sp.]|uniref:bifunctional tRNA (5-methylaminomethyl-2-thiouridine)(34)-methyltransferase MnmD/FAD-dependent 5-carboxymethylaminomethyl-2-thiouridine(34) oxidoreductase MnmC n=1 Tax=Legionella sp. TaxID=459 RepID=UPI0039E71446
MSKFFVPIKTAALSWHDELPFSLEYNDIYHSTQNGIEQSRYVFVDGNNLIPRWQALTQETFTLGETGFGMGLNFLLAWKLWEEHAPQSSCLHFISCEQHPFMRDDLIRALKHWPQVQKYAQQLITKYPVLTPGYHHLSFAQDRVRLTLMLGDVLECYEQLLICGDAQLESTLRASFIDAWYLDGFAPTKNERMWSDTIFKVIALLSKPGTTLATYTAAAVVKKSLKQNGFTVEKKKGFGEKRHMVSAYFNTLPAQSIKCRHTPWQQSYPERYNKKSAIIIGAGLAGCFTAHALAKRGWQITLIDEHDRVGMGASANQQAVLFPKLSAYTSPLTQLMLSAFLYARTAYESILKQADIGELNGSLLLAHNKKEQLAQASLFEWLQYYPSLGVLVSPEQASKLSGLPLEESGLFIPFSGWINSPALCQFLVNCEAISLVTNTKVEQLHYDKQWQVNDWETEVLILANGYQITSFKEAEYLPIKPIRGQMTTITSTHESSLLKVPLFAVGHVLPQQQGVHRLGATYELKTAESSIKHQDDLLNLAKLQQLVPAVSWSEEIIEQWAGVRATTTDYLPIVGRIVNASQFRKVYAGLESNSKRWIAQAGPYYPGLYACTGFGSRGLTTIPLCAEWLASLINQEVSFLPRNLQQALSPARFLRKNILRGK